MTEVDWKNFIRHFTDTLPDVASWLQKAGAGTLAVWKEKFASVDLCDAKAAVDAVIDGKIAVPSPWSLLLPSLLGFASRQSLARRQGSAPPVAERPTIGVRHPMAAMFDCIRQCLDGGMSTDAAMVVLDRRFPIADEDRQRVKCQECDDTGWVEVWGIGSIRSLQRGDERVKKYRESALCMCAKGHWRQRPAESLPPGAIPQPRYNPAIHCRWNTGEVAELREWLDWKKSQGVRHHPNYHEEFAGYGQESF